MTRATFAAAIEALRPRPGSSASPSRPDLAKRVDHIENALGRRAQPFGNGFDTETLDAKQDDVGTLAIAHTNCR